VGRRGSYDEADRPASRQITRRAIRSRSFDPYRFFYRVKGGTVWVVAAWHGAQIPDAPGEVIEG